MSKIEKKQTTALTTIKNILRSKKEKHSKNLIDFIRQGIEQNDGDYDRISKRMFVISEFFKSIKDDPTTRGFSGLTSAYNDFFVSSDRIKNVIFSDTDHSALYTKEYKKHNITLDKDIYQKTLHGVAVTTELNSNSPILYFGARRSLAEKMREDTGILFMDDGIVYHNEGLTRYDEIPLYGKGAHGDFHFDSQDRLTSVTIKTMTEPRLGWWGDPITIDFDCGYFRLNNDYTGNYLKESDKEL